MKNKACPVCKTGTANIFVALSIHNSRMLKTSHAEICLDCAFKQESHKSREPRVRNIPAAVNPVIANIRMAVHGLARG